MLTFGGRVLKGWVTGDASVLNRQNRLDQAGITRCGLRMAQIAFNLKLLALV